MLFKYYGQNILPKISRERVIWKLPLLMPMTMGFGHRLIIISKWCCP
jgi:hypothetical protein